MDEQYQLTDEEAEDVLDILAEQGNTGMRFLECIRCIAAYRYETVKRKTICPNCNYPVKWMFFRLPV